MNSKLPVITIDGPAGSGKGTVAKIVSRKLSLNYLDSGAIYRLLALSSLLNNVSSSDVDQLVTLATSMDVEFKLGTNDALAVYLNSEDVTEAIRDEKTGDRASEIASIPRVRAALLSWQRDCCKSPGLVAEGRDMGTVVFPSARLKIYLTATPEERAQRRYKQLKEKDLGVSLARVFEDMVKRDARDSNRENAPLKPASDAVILNSDGLSIEQVVDVVFQHASERFDLAVK